jgi:hypothetical protein
MEQIRYLKDLFPIKNSNCWSHGKQNPRLVMGEGFNVTTIPAYILFIGPARR